MVIRALKYFSIVWKYRLREWKCTTKAVVKIRPEKNSGLYGMWTHDLCDTGAALYQLS